jgi:2-polyprenyl-3-methyl-5-hydroxy-6-metoxy-1,4-benzoquinol methylase
MSAPETDHEDWAERVLPDDLASVNGTAHLARYLFAAHWAPGRRSLDLCCGAGYGTGLLHAAGASYALGIDIDPAAIAMATERYARPGAVEYGVGDAQEPLSARGMRLATCFEGIEHVERPDALLRNLASTLDADGVAVVSTPNADASGGHSGNPFHVQEFTRRQFEDMLAATFRTVRLFFQWNARDPYGFEWSLPQLTRALIPVEMKRRLRRPSAAEPVVASGEGGAGDGARPPWPILMRPYPAEYLSQPGLRGAQPALWIAVCHGVRS